MKTLLIGTFLFLTPIYVSIQTMGQDFAGFLQKLETLVEKRDKQTLSIQSAEPQWKLISKEVRETSSFHSWKSGRDGLTIQIVYASSEHDAEQKLDKIMNGISLQITKMSERDLTREGLSDLGSDVYNYGSSIYFRNSNVVVSVFATSTELARKYAKGIAALIKEK